MTQYQIPASLIKTIEPDSLIIPSRPLRVVFDLGGAGSLRSPDGMTIYSTARSKEDADLGIMPVRIDYAVEYGQEVADMVFVPVWGDRVGKPGEKSKLPFGLLCVVKLKRNGSGTGSLDTFEVELIKQTPTGRHPATYIWRFFAERKTGTDAEGVGISWHRLHWFTSEVEDDRSYKMLCQLGAMKESDPNFDSLPRSKAIEQVPTLAASPTATPDDMPQLEAAPVSTAKPPALPASKPPAVPGNPPPALAQPAVQWFIPNRENPISIEELLKIANPDTKVWREGLPDWTEISKTELAERMF